MAGVLAKLPGDWEKVPNVQNSFVYMLASKNPTRRHAGIKTKLFILVVLYVIYQCLV